jgi:hypothetical protein
MYPLLSPIKEKALVFPITSNRISWLIMYEKLPVFIRAGVFLRPGCRSGRTI